MKFVLKTKRSVGDRNLSRRGIQFRARFITDPADDADTENAMRDVARAVAADVRECGHYLSWQQETAKPLHGGAHDDAGGDKLTPREAALKAQLKTTTQIAKKATEDVARLRKIILNRDKQGADHDDQIIWLKDVIAQERDQHAASEARKNAQIETLRAQLEAALVGRNERTAK